MVYQLARCRLSWGAILSGWPRFKSDRSYLLGDTPGSCYRRNYPNPFDTMETDGENMDNTGVEKHPRLNLIG